MNNKSDVELWGPDTFGIWAVNWGCQVVARTQNEACALYTERTGTAAYSAYPTNLTCGVCGEWPDAEGVDTEHADWCDGHWSPDP